MIPLDEWSARRRDLITDNTQHSQETAIHAQGGIRARNSSKQAAADPRFRPRGRWYRQLFVTDMRNFGGMALVVAEIKPEVNFKKTHK